MVNSPSPADCLLVLSLAFLSCCVSGPSAAQEHNGGSGPHAASDEECVVLVHGLGRTSSSMKKMELSIRNDGYTTVSLNYPSREKPVEILAEETIPEALEYCDQYSSRRVHFITHSMGGILVRYYLAMHTLENLGRVVMISPPSQGSELVDKLSGLPGFEYILGPAVFQLGTDSDSLPRKLGPVDFDAGIITGDRSINPILSLLIPGDDDGKVSVENAKLAGVSEFLVVHHTHTFILNSDAVIKQAIHFLKYGKFKQ